MPGFPPVEATPFARSELYSDGAREAGKKRKNRRKQQKPEFFDIAAEEPEHFDIDSEAERWQDHPPEQPGDPHPEPERHEEAAKTDKEQGEALEETEGGEAAGPTDWPRLGQCPPLGRKAHQRWSQPAGEDPAALDQPRRVAEPDPEGPEQPRALPGPAEEAGGAGQLVRSTMATGWPTLQQCPPIRVKQVRFQTAADPPPFARSGLYPDSARGEGKGKA